MSGCSDGLISINLISMGSDLISARLSVGLSGTDGRSVCRSLFVRRTDRDRRWIQTSGELRPNGVYRTARRLSSSSVF